MLKNPPANAGDTRDVCSIPGSGSSPAGEHGHPLQYSGLEKSRDRGARQATVHRIAKSWTQPSDGAHRLRDITETQLSYL